MPCVAGELKQGYLCKMQHLEIADHIHLWYLSAFNREARAIKLVAVAGGSINQAFRVEVDGEAFFLKMNDAKAFPGMFEAEAKGLEVLKGKSPLSIPTPLHWGADNKNAFILMEWVTRGTSTPENDFAFGEALAILHNNTAETFGLDHNNYIGSLPQSNKQHSTWVDFFVTERLEPQLRLAIDKGELDRGIVRRFENLFSQLEGIFPPTQPSLLHGDLWSGNYCITSTGAAAIFDPAVYYGHREVDLAMTKLFGGFSADFYAGYQQAFILEKGFANRVAIYNLYPLLVHVNLFGGGYAQDVKNTLSVF